MIAPLAGGLLVVISALLLYLAAPHQKWSTLPFPPRVAGWSGLAALGGGLALLLSWAGVATACFIAMTLLMTAWSIVPAALAWRRDGGKSA